MTALYRDDRRVVGPSPEDGIIVLVPCLDLHTMYHVNTAAARAREPSGSGEKSRRPRMEACSVTADFFTSSPGFPE